jgi:type I restriction enzyme, S subunit
MEVKTGYKHTEAGVIPEGWDCVKLGSFISLQRGHDLTWRDRRNGDVPVMGSAGQNGFHDTAIAKGPGVVLGRSGASFGQAHYCEQDFWPHNTALYVTDFRGNHPLFVFYFLASIDFSRHNSGGAQQSLNRNFIYPMAIGVPRPPEQRAIAAGLNDVYGLLGRLDRLIAKKRDLKQAAVQQLLTGQTRLPGFHGEWKVKSLFELAERKKELFDDGDWIEAEFLTDSGIRLVQTGNIGKGTFADKEAKKYISAESFKKLRCKELQIGDILICRLAEPAGRACVLPDIGEKRLITAVDVTIFRPPASVADRHFLVHMFNTRQWFGAVNERCGGSTRTRIARGQLGKIEIKLPAPPEQIAIAGVLSDMDGELAALEQRREKTLALKQAMMQELLTGKTRLV